MPKTCPPVTVNVDAVVEAAKREVLKSCPSLAKGDSDEHVNFIGLGPIRIAEPQIKPTMFITGYVVVPAIVNFSTKLMQVGVMPMVPQVDLAVSRGVAAGLTLAATLLTGGKSFMLGALLGQIPSTLDALADVAVAAVVKMKAGAGAPLPQAPATPGVSGLGSEADELRKLQADLQRLQGPGSEFIREQESMAGTRSLGGSHMTVR